MANRTIESPGVEIFETDLSQIASLPVGTKVLVPGFAKQGPTYELNFITSNDELNQVYGTPETAAERYFYHTCKEVLRSPATLLTTRIPYGSAGDGSGYDGGYSILVYPDATTDYKTKLLTDVSSEAGNTAALTALGNYILSTSALSTGPLAPLSTLELFPAVASIPAFATLPSTETIFLCAGAGPSQLTALSSIVYPSIYPMSDFYNTGFAFGAPAFSAVSGDQYQKLISNQFNFSSYNSVFTPSQTAAMIVINKSKTSINELGEGYYVSLADTSVADSTDVYDAVSAITTITSANALATGPMLDTVFGLPLTGDNSYSEMIETGFTYDIADPSFDDAVVLTISRFRTSSQTAGSNKLYVGYTEKYIGSLDPADVYRTDPVTKAQASFFLENKVNAKSDLMTVLVNPTVKSKVWSVTGGGRVGVVVATDKSAYGFGTYASSRAGDSKVIGAVPAKVERALSFADNKETLDVDIVCEAGLGTVYAYAKVSDNGLFDETANVADKIEKLEDQDIGDSCPMAINYKAVFETFRNFVQEVRKDCIYIADPLRGIFVQGADFKMRDQKGPNDSFSSNFYWPMKNLYSTGNSNYVCTYGNWVKAYDPTMDDYVWLPFSGFEASIMARMDSSAQPWFAPAGLNRGIIRNIVDIAIEPRQKERDWFYKIGINPITQFPQDGFVVYGQKTLQALPSAFDRINVRRLFLVLERATLKMARYFVMEPNTTFTRTRLINTLKPIFDIAVANDGIYDYMIVCDTRNNTPQVIDQNELKVDIYIKPVRAAEYILINFIATRTDADFTELIG